LTCGVCVYARACVRARVVGWLIRLFAPASLVGHIASPEWDETISVNSETGGMWRETLRHIVCKQSSHHWLKMKKLICTVGVGKISCRLVGFTATHCIWDCRWWP
jgi:hypothetical protein